MKRFGFLALIVLLASCGQRFDKNGWNIHGDMGTWPNRNEMLNDLLKNHQLKGLTYHQLVETVGKPEIDINDPYKAYYDVDIKFAGGTSPVYNKYLIMRMSKDSVITSVEVKEWKL